MTSPKRTHEYARQPNRESAIRITISVHTNATLFGPDSPAPRTSVQCSIGIAANVIGHENMKTLYNLATENRRRRLGKTAIWIRIEDDPAMASAYPIWVVYGVYESYFRGWRQLDCRRHAHWKRVHLILWECNRRVRKRHQMPLPRNKAHIRKGIKHQW